MLSTKSKLMLQSTFKSILSTTLKNIQQKISDYYKNGMTKLEIINLAMQPVQIFTEEQLKKSQKRWKNKQKRLKNKQKD